MCPHPCQPYLVRATPSWRTSSRSASTSPASASRQSSAPNMTRAPRVIKRARVIASTPLGFRRTHRTYPRPTWGCACGGANEASRIATRDFLNGVSYPPRPEPDAPQRAAVRDQGAQPHEGRAGTRAQGLPRRLCRVSQHAHHHHRHRRLQPRHHAAAAAASTSTSTTSRVTTPPPRHHATPHCYRACAAAAHRRGLIPFFRKRSHDCKLVRHQARFNSPTTQPPRLRSMQGMRRRRRATTSGLRRGWWTRSCPTCAPSARCDHDHDHAHGRADHERMSHASTRRTWSR